MTSSASTSELARLIGVHAPYDGTFELRVPGVFATRVSDTNTEVLHALMRSAVCIVAQGAKSIMLGETVHATKPGRSRCTPSMFLWLRRSRERVVRSRT